MAYPRKHFTPEQKREANAAAQRRWREKPENRQKATAQAAAWRASLDPEHRRAINALSNNHQRAKRLGLPSGAGMREWRRVLEAHGQRCVYCGAEGCPLDIDHLQPMSRGGPNLVWNLAPACRRCNSEKGTLNLDEYAQSRGFSPTPIRARADSLRV